MRGRERRSGAFRNGQQIDVNLLGRTKNDGTLDHVLQFTDVAGPRIRLNRIESGFCESSRRTPIVGGIAQQKTFREQSEIFRPLAQRRHDDRDDIQAIQQIFAERVLFDHVGEIAIGRGDDAHVRAPRDRVADAFVFAILDEAQQFRLQRKRHIADFIEKQSAAFGLIDATQFIFGSAGKRAFFVTEQFALEQLGRKRRAIHCHEIFFRTRDCNDGSSWH